jgi:hypothetical protein
MSAQLSLYDFIGDLVVFRNLSPVDPQIPGYERAWAEMGMAGPYGLARSRLCALASSAPGASGGASSS